MKDVPICWRLKENSESSWETWKILCWTLWTKSLAIFLRMMRSFQPWKPWRPKLLPSLARSKRPTKLWRRWSKSVTSTCHFPSPLQESTSLCRAWAPFTSCTITRCNSSWNWSTPFWPQTSWLKSHVRRVTNVWNISSANCLPMFTIRCLMVCSIMTNWSSPLDWFKFVWVMFANARLISCSRLRPLSKTPTCPIPSCKVNWTSLSRIPCPTWPPIRLIKDWSTILKATKLVGWVSWTNPRVKTSSPWVGKTSLTMTTQKKN